MKQRVADGVAKLNQVARKPIAIGSNGQTLAIAVNGRPTANGSNGQSRAITVR